MGSPADPVLDRVAEFRKAARIAVDSPSELRKRLLALIEIMDMARREPDPVVARWSELAIFEESRPLLGMDDEALTVPAEPYSRAQRRLRSQGYATCPECRSSLATEAQLDSWSDLRRAESDRLAMRERAVGS